MGNEARTTEDLRETLFDTLDQLCAGKKTPQEAAQICNISQTILKTAEIEIKYALTLDKLDKSDTGISPGRLFLTNKKKA